MVSVPLVLKYVKSAKNVICSVTEEYNRVKLGKRERKANSAWQKGLKMLYGIDTKFNLEKETVSWGTNRYKKENFTDRPLMRDLVKISKNLRKNEWINECMNKGMELCQ